MKILQINKFFYIKGGTDRYFFEVVKLLRNHGHRVASFSMQDKRNIKSRWSKYFVSNISFEDTEIRGSIYKIIRMIYSVEARRKISVLLDIWKPDIAHLHSIYHHLSPSILIELKKRNIPIVQTLHDYHLISPNHSLFHKRQVCEITKPDRFYKALFHKCVKDSFLATGAEILEKYIHKYLGWEKNNIDYFLVPSEFMKNKLIEYNLPEEKLIHLPNFVNYHNFRRVSQKEEYILYFGRLSSEKGLMFLLHALSNLPNIKLKIIGSGPEMNSLRDECRVLKLQNIEFLGFKEGKSLVEIIENCKFSILPSLWYENCPISVLESSILEKPVIASKIGGIQEMIKDSYNGFLFEPGNIEDCREKILKLWNNTALCRKMGKNAREYVEKNFGPEEHYRKLMEIYQMAIKKHL